MLGALAAGAGAAVLYGSRRAGAAAVAARAEAIGRRNGLRVGFGDPAGFFVPPWGPGDAVIPGGVAAPAAAADLAPALDGIELSLGRYPPGFFARLCQAIFLCGPLRFGGVPGGGTYGPAWIVLAADPAATPGGIYETARLGVHHEFSSLVWFRLPGLMARWEALLPAGWRPVEGTAEALGHTGAGDEAAGFLSAYAATSAENDFNTYAEVAFGDPLHLRDLAGRVPAVRRRASLLLGAYAALDGRLAETFRGLGLGGLPIEPVENTGTDAGTGTIAVPPSNLPQPVVGR